MSFCLISLARGLSPRVRGNLPRGPCLPLAVRPIPACAGQPTKAVANCRHPRAYPRVCGATRLSQKILRRILGLSPRVRGNPRLCIAPWKRKGPIPACAGQPLIFGLWMNLHWAYPRVCGATLARLRLLLLSLGLSPRVRGNLSVSVCERPQLGPIPACAGQPKVRARTIVPIAAYPRVCGATSCT